MNSEKIKQFYMQLKTIKSPPTIWDCVTGIDQYILGAQQGFEISTEMFIYAKEAVRDAEIKYKSTYYTALKASKEPVTIKKELARAEASEEDKNLTMAQHIALVASMEREKWIERLNTLKKIKSGDKNFTAG